MEMGKVVLLFSKCEMQIFCSQYTQKRIIFREEIGKPEFFGKNSGLRRDQKRSVLTDYFHRFFRSINRQLNDIHF